MYEDPTTGDELCEIVRADSTTTLEHCDEALEGILRRAWHAFGWLLIGAFAVLLLLGGLLAGVYSLGALIRPPPA